MTSADTARRRSPALTDDDLVVEVHRIMSEFWPDYIMDEHEADHANALGMRIAGLARRGMVPISRPPARVTALPTRT